MDKHSSLVLNLPDDNPKINDDVEKEKIENILEEEKTEDIKQ